MHIIFNLYISGSGAQRVRANLYGALLFYLQIAQKPKTLQVLNAGKCILLENSLKCHVDLFCQCVVVIKYRHVLTVENIKAIDTTFEF